MAVRDVVALALKLLVASLTVGLVFSAFDIHPRRLLRDVPDLIRDAFRLAMSAVDWAIPYIILGAVVVVPIWALFALFRAIRR